MILAPGDLGAVCGRMRYLGYCIEEHPRRKGGASLLGKLRGLSENLERKRAKSFSVVEANDFNHFFEADVFVVVAKFSFESWGEDWSWKLAAES